MDGTSMRVSQGRRILLTYAATFLVFGGLLSVLFSLFRELDLSHASLVDNLTTQLSRVRSLTVGLHDHHALVRTYLHTGDETLKPEIDEQRRKIERSRDDLALLVTTPAAQEQYTTLSLQLEDYFQTINLLLEIRHEDGMDAAAIARPDEHLLAAAEAEINRLVLSNAGGLRQDVENLNSTIKGLRVIFLLLAASSATIVLLLTMRVNRAQHRASASEQRYRRLPETIRDGFVVVDPGGALLESNGPFQAMLGYSAKELRGLRHEEITPPTWHDLERNILETQVQTRGFSDIYEKEYRRKDGTIFPAEIRTHLVDPASGAEGGMWAIIRDITDRRNAERKIQEEVRRLRLLREMAMIFTQVTDLQSLCTRIYASIPEIMGVDRASVLLYDRERNVLVGDETIGVSPRLLSIPSFSQRIDESLSGKCFSTNAPVLENNCPTTSIIPRDFVQALQLKSALAVPIRLKDQVLGVLRIDDTQKTGRFTQHDVEFFSHVADQLAIALENARLFSERQQFEEQLLTSLREKEVLLKEIHHRVKNNLQVISSLLSLQADTSGDQHLRTLLGESRNRVRSMALVHERLYHSDDLGRVEFQEYVSTLAAELVRSFGHPGVTCTVQADPISLGIDTAVPCGLILNEMLTNALKHGFPGEMTGTVVIEVTRIDNEHVRLSVRDSGKGFPPEADLDQTRSMGLMLIKSLTDQLGGTLSLENQGGAVCTVVFPSSA
jgi:PAS domain S-box-containing protein